MFDAKFGNNTAMSRSRKLEVAKRRPRRPIAAAIDLGVAKLQTAFEKQMFEHLNAKKATLPVAIGYVTFNSK